LLLGRDPWVLHYAAADGAMLPFTARATLDWAWQIAVGGDGSVYVGGHGMFGGSVRTVQVQQFDPSGELIATARWPGTDGARFAGITTAADGSVRVAVQAASNVPVIEGGTLFFPGLSVHRVNGAELVDPLGPFLMHEFGFGADTSTSILDAHELAFGDTGDLVFGGESSDYDTWLGFVSDGTIAGGLNVADSFADAHLGGVAPDGAGGWYWGYGSGWTNAISGLGAFRFELHRSTARTRPGAATAMGTCATPA
jgi:hypothetical protein